MLTLDQLPYIEYVTDAGDTRRIYADVWLSDDVDATATATQNAVETGALLSDHYHPDPVNLKGTLVFSEEPIRGDLDPAHVGRTQTIPISYPAYPNNTPLLSPGGLTNAAGAGLAAVAGAVGINVGVSLPSSYAALRFNEAPGRGRTAYRTLMALRDARKSVAIGTSMDRYEDCVLLGIHVARKAEDGTSVPIELTLQQVQFATTEEAKAVPLPLEPRGAKAPTDAKGKDGAVDAGAQTGILKGILNKAGVTATGSGVSPP